MERRMPVLTSAEREAIAYDVSQSRAMVNVFHCFLERHAVSSAFCQLVDSKQASLIATAIQTVVFHNTQVWCQATGLVDGLANAFAFWIGRLPSFFFVVTIVQCVPA